MLKRIFSHVKKRARLCWTTRSNFAGHISLTATLGTCCLRSCQSFAEDVSFFYTLSCGSTISCIEMHRLEDIVPNWQAYVWNAPSAREVHLSDARISEHCNSARVYQHLACNMLHYVNLHTMQPGQRDSRYGRNEFTSGFGHVDNPCCVCSLM